MLNSTLSSKQRYLNTLMQETAKENASGLRSFSWWAQVSRVVAVLVPAWLHSVRAWADMFDNDGRVAHLGTLVPCSFSLGHLGTGAEDHL